MSTISLTLELVSVLTTRSAYGYDHIEFKVRSKEDANVYGILYMEAKAGTKISDLAAGFMVCGVGKMGTLVIQPNKEEQVT